MQWWPCFQGPKKRNCWESEYRSSPRVGIYIKWRNSGYRLLNRLEEFVEGQDARLKKSRAELSALVQYPAADGLISNPAFPPRPLNRRLRAMNWGYGTASTTNLREAVELSASQAKLSNALHREHQHREALAHLLLGARAASRIPADPIERSAARSLALEHFDRALAIDPLDSEALEYSGMMLLELNQPVVALQRFEALTAQRKDGGDKIALARSYRLQAIAHEQKLPPNKREAYTALSRAAQELPSECTLEHAITYEHFAMAAHRLDYNQQYNTNLGKAWSFYHRLRKSRAGAEGLARTSAKLAAVNNPLGILALDGSPTSLRSKWPRRLKVFSKRQRQAANEADAVGGAGG